MNSIRREPLRIVLRRGHPAAQADVHTLLTRYPWAIPSRYFNENELFSNLKSHMAKARHYRLTSLTACLSLAEASDVVTLAPDSLVSAGSSPYRLVPSPVDINLTIHFALFTIAANSPTPAVRALQSALTRG